MRLRVGPFHELPKVNSRAYTCGNALTCLLHGSLFYNDILKVDILNNLTKAKRLRAQSQAQASSISRGLGICNEKIKAWENNEEKKIDILFCIE